MKPKLKIEHGIEVPPITRGRYKLALTEMKEGDSFVVDDRQGQISALVAAKRLGVPVTTRKITGLGYRLWRLP